MPPEIYVAVWYLEDGRRMPAITTKQTFDEWSTAPEEYAHKRLTRFNHRIVRHGRTAVGFRVDRYVLASTCANFAKAG